MPRARTLPRYVLAVVAWLPLTFTLWYLAAPVLLWPVYLLIRLVCVYLLGAIVVSIDQSAATLLFATSLRPGATIGGGQVSVEVNLLLYSFGLPLFAALTIATRDFGWQRKLLLGYIAMLPFIAWGALADFLKNIAITAGPAVAAQAGFSSLQREAIAFAFQVGSLILPAVVPAVAWVLLHRRFLEEMRRDLR